MSAFSVMDFSIVAEATVAAVREAVVIFVVSLGFYCTLTFCLWLPCHPFVNVRKTKPSF